MKNSRIESGVKLYIEPNCQSSERYAISNGSYLIENEEFLSESFVPRGPWSEPTPTEKTIIESEKPGEYYNSVVSIVALPKKLAELFKATGVQDANDRDDAKQILLNNKEMFQDINKHMNQFVNSFIVSEKRKGIHGIFVGEPGLVGVARPDAEQGLAGLHFDKNQPFKSSDLSPNRICFNIGSTERYLLFVNKTMAEVLTKVLEKLPNYNFEADYDDLAKTFLELYPNYPVVRVKLKPYEAYIAPTNNIIHDGSTEGATGKDVTLVFVGHFNAKN